MNSNRRHVSEFQILNPGSSPTWSEFDRFRRVDGSNASWGSNISCLFRLASEESAHGLKICL